MGLALAGLLCLGAVGAAGWKAGRQGMQEYRKAFLYRPATADIVRCDAPEEEIDEQGRRLWCPGRVAYEFVLGDRLYTGEHVQAPPRRRPTGYEPDLAGPEDVGSQITVYYDPADPRRNTTEPVAEIEPAVIAIMVLPLAAWGVWFLVGAIAGVSVKPKKGSRQESGPQDRPIAMGRLSTEQTRAVKTSAPPQTQTRATLLPWGLIVYSVVSLVGAALAYWAAPRLACERAWLLAAGLAGAVNPLAAILLGMVLTDAAKERPPKALVGPSGPQAQVDKSPEELARDLRGTWAMAAVMIVGGLLVAALSAYLAGRAAWEQANALRRLASVWGRVHSSTVEKVAEETAAGPAVRYRPAVSFLYRVGRVEYFSSRLRPREQDYAEERAAQADADRFPRGKPVVVYYEPAEPQEGVLIPSLPLESPQQLVWAPLAVLTGLLFAGWGAALPLGVRRVRRFLDSPARLPWRIPSLGVLRDGPDGLEIHRRRGPLAAAWLGYAAIAGIIFLAASLRRHGSGEAMSLAGVTYGVISCLSAATACGLLATRKTRLRLVLDTENRLLTAGEDRRSFTLSFDDIAAWTVGWFEPGASRGNARAQHGSRGQAAVSGRRKRRRSPALRTPVLGIRTAAGQEAKIQLFTGVAPWPDRLAAARKTAEELARITGSAVEAVGPELR